jgi:hypothetical protein
LSKCFWSVFWKRVLAVGLPARHAIDMRTHIDPKSMETTFKRLKRGKYKARWFYLALRQIFPWARNLPHMEEAEKWARLTPIFLQYMRCTDVREGLPEKKP